MNILLCLKNLGSNILLHFFVLLIIISMKIYNTTIDLKDFIKQKIKN